MNERSVDWGIWGLRLLALGIAIGIWFNASVEDRLVSSEKTVEANISYNRPRGFLIMNPVRNVNVRLLGSQRAIRQLNPFQVDVQVNLAQEQEGTVVVTLLPEDVLAPDGLEVVSIEPKTIRVDLEREMTLRLPVVARVEGKPGGGAKAGEPEVFPNQVLVTGPESILAVTESLRTPEISMEGRTSTFEVTAQVLPPDPMIQIVQPTQVTVRIPIQAPQPPPRKEEP